MTLTVRTVAQQHIAQTWPLVENYLAEAQKHCENDYTVEQIKVYLANGQWLLIVAVDESGVVHGAATINFVNMPNDRSAFITFIGGKLISNKETYKQMVDIFKHFGATKIQGAARESVARLWSRYGFKERYRIVEAKI